MLAYNNVIFDLDGTLLDTLQDLASATNHALARFGMPERTIDEVRAFVGNGILNLIRRAVPAGCDPKTIESVHAEFDRYYAAHSKEKTSPYPCVSALIQSLTRAGACCCVVSNKGDYAVQPLVREFFGDSFAVVCGEREAAGIRRKPWPDTVRACMDEVGSDASDTVYVGDSEVDILTARNAGIACISVTWGFRDEAYLRGQGAQTFAHTTDELAELLGV